MQSQKIDISLTSILSVFAVLIALIGLFLIREVVVVVFIAIVLASALDPIVDWFERFSPRWVGVLAVFTTIFSIFLLMGYLIVPPVAHQTTSLINDFRNGHLNFSVYDIQINSQTLSNQFHENASTFSNSLKPVLNTTQDIVAGLASVIGVLILTIYMLLDEKIMKQSVVDLVPAKYRDDVIRISSKIGAKMGAWFRGQVFLGLSVGVFALIGLWLLGVKYALTLALFAGITELIPIIGPFLGAGAAILVALSDDPSKAILIALWYLVLQQLEGHVLVPQIMRKALGLSPVVIVVALLIGAKLMGILGVILAVPVASAVSVLVDEYSQAEQRRRKTVK